MRLNSLRNTIILLNNVVLYRLIHRSSKLRIIRSRIHSQRSTMQTTTPFFLLLIDFIILSFFSIFFIFNFNFRQIFQLLFRLKLLTVIIIVIIIICETLFRINNVIRIYSLLYIYILILGALIIKIIIIALIITYNNFVYPILKFISSFYISFPLIKILNNFNVFIFR